MGLNNRPKAGPEVEAYFDYSKRSEEEKSQFINGLAPRNGDISVPMVVLPIAGAAGLLYFLWLLF